MNFYHVIIEPEAQQDLENIYGFIATDDTKIQAVRFLRKLQKAINSLNFLPQRCRKSFYIPKDMILQGYTICYAIKEDTVHILAVFRQRTA